MNYQYYRRHCVESVCVCVCLMPYCMAHTQLMNEHLKNERTHGKQTDVFFIVWVPPIIKKSRKNLHNGIDWTGKTNVPYKLMIICTTINIKCVRQKIWNHMAFAGNEMGACCLSESFEIFASMHTTVHDWIKWIFFTINCFGFVQKSQKLHVWMVVPAHFHKYLSFTYFGKRVKKLYKLCVSDIALYGVHCTLHLEQCTAVQTFETSKFNVWITDADYQPLTL